MPGTADTSRHADLFFGTAVSSYLSNPRFLRRDWLAAEVEARLGEPNCRFLLLTAAPGSGKSAFMAQLAHDHPKRPVYFLRRDQRTPLADAGAHSFLLRIGYQLAAIYPELFTQERVKLVVEQRIGAVEESGEVVAAEVKKILASPFYDKVVQVRQHVDRTKGSVTGLRIDELVVDPHLLSLDKLQNLALFDPARALLDSDPDKQIVILVDALDEIRYHGATGTLLEWLTDCPELPSNVRFVLTSRPPDDALLVFREKQQPFLQPLTIEAEDENVQQELRIYAEGLTGEKKVAAILEETEPGVGGFIEEAVDKAAGNIGYLDALGRGIDQALANDDINALGQLLTLEELPDQIEGLYAFFLRQIKETVEEQGVRVEDPETGKSYIMPVWTEAYRPILGVLAVALEPLSAGQISQLGDIKIEFSYVTEAINRLRQFLDPPIDNCYRLYHATLPEFLTAKHTQEHADTATFYVNPTDWHKQIASYYWGACHDDWQQCDVYGFRYLPGHLIEAGRVKELRGLLFDFNWLQAKLDATDVTSLIADHDYLPAEEALRAVQGALRLSAHVLLADKAQLAGQLHGRLLSFRDPDIQTMLEQAKQEKTTPWLRPMTPSLRSPGGLLLHTLTGHEGTVRAVAVTPVGNLAVSASADATLRVWDLESGTELYSLDGHEDQVYSVAVTPDGKRAISASNDKTLIVWNLDKRIRLLTLRGHDGPVRAVAVTRDGRRVISSSLDATVGVWDLESGESLQMLEGHDGYYHAVAVTPDGKRAITAALDKLVVWDLENALKLHVLSGHTEDVAGVTVTPDGQQVISASYDRTLRIWDLENGVALRTLEGHDAGVNGVAVTPNGRWAISASEDFTLIVWDPRSGEKLRTLDGHNENVKAVAVTPDGTYAISASSDSTLKVWNLKGVAELQTSVSRDILPDWKWVMPDGRHVLSVSDEYNLVVWNLESRKTVFSLRGHADRVRVAVVTPSGQRAISASDDNTLRVWDLEARAELFAVPGHGKEICAVAATPDGRHAISASLDDTLRVWDLERGMELRNLHNQGSQIKQLVLTPDAQRAITVSYDGHLQVWDLERGASLLSLGHHGYPISPRNLVGYVTPDGRWAIYSADEHCLKVVDLELLTEAHILPCDYPTAATITPDGRRAIAALINGTLKVWDLERGVEPPLLTGHDWPATGVAVTRDGQRAISVAGFGFGKRGGSPDCSLKVWDLEGGDLITSFTGESALQNCAIVEDGVTFVSGPHILRLEGQEIAGSP